MKNTIMKFPENKTLNIEKKGIERYFSEILQNEHKGFEHERLYVFGKNVTLLERRPL